MPERVHAADCQGTIHLLQPCSMADCCHAEAVPEAAACGGCLPAAAAVRLLTLLAAHLCRGTSGPMSLEPVFTYGPRMI